MNILHVIPTYVPAWRHGGPIYSVHGLARAQVRRGHRVVVYTTNVHVETTLDVPLGVAVEVDGVEVRYFPVGWPRRLYRSPALGRELARSLGRFDLAHLHSLFLWPTSAAARAAVRAGVPYLLAPRGMLVPELIRRRGALRKRLWLRLVEQQTLRQAAALHVTGAEEARQARATGLALPPVVEVPNGIDAGALRDDPAVPLPPEVAALGPAPFVLYLGRLSWKKGLEKLVAALALAPRLHLVIAGNDDEGLTPALHQQAQALGAASRLVFTGHVSGSTKAALLARCALLALPSRSENFANAVLEAMAAGRPVVVSPEVGLSEVIAAEGAGLVVPAEPEPLAKALAAILDDPELAAEMGRRGAALAGGRYAWDAVARRMDEAYHAILAGTMKSTRP